MQLKDYLRKPVSRMLERSPFNGWPVERSVEDGLEEPIVEYVFAKNGLELRCTADEVISAIFMFSTAYGGFDDSLFEISFSEAREGVLKHFGVPTESGAPVSDPVLGEYGAWDRFSRPGGVVIHVEYTSDAGAIAKITLMCS